MSVSTPGCLECESPPIPEEMSFFYHLTQIHTPNYTWSPGQSKDFDLHIRAYFRWFNFRCQITYENWAILLSTVTSQNYSKSKLPVQNVNFVASQTTVHARATKNGV